MQSFDCGKAFGKLGDRNKHMIVHTQVRNCQFSLCGKAFVQNEHLMKHMLVLRNNICTVITFSIRNVIAITHF